MSKFSRFSTNVLTVKNFPLLFNDQDRQEFLEHFGAVRVFCLERFKNLSNIIIADFGSSSQASQALLRLHQLEIFTRRLVVEFCPLELVQIAFSSKFPFQNVDDNVYEDDDSIKSLHGISPGKNKLYYSLPSERLSYSYPPINDTILTNINSALISVPAFYTQVLHLMNKMSLPCPMIFDSMADKRNVSTTSIACQTDESTLTKVINMDTDDDNESEIDDGEEERRVKRRYRSIIKEPVRQGTIPRQQAQMTIDIEIKKKPMIELKLPQTLVQSRVDEHQSIPIDISMTGFGRLEPQSSMISNIEIGSGQLNPPPPLSLISEEELSKNRLTENELRLIDNGRLYQNYERGTPCQRLYIKNLNTKYVDERILHSIFDRYKDESSQIDIRLMREGKMKGQAFVTFPNEEKAFQALMHTNGFVLYEKPMIVQFARSAKPKDIL